MPLLLLGVMVGAVTPIQTAVNSRLRMAVGTPFRASFVSFLVGLLTLLVIVLVHDRGFGLHRALGGGNPWWMWFGGFLGSLVVLTNSVLSPLLGTGLTVLVALLGQVIGGLLIDTFGWFAVARRRVGVVQIAGIVVAVAGIALIRLG
ncbi:DMT family transporter [uncultured Bifidobacterium sp.]|uniref:DMT family transporter n=1 Tax=uncultured Bifidobacterium sp. TaxID=165187 RepID=UPI00258A55A1|nr:DMT family transporter [uncultured Bifidobacterium sp.]